MIPLAPAFYFRFFNFWSFLPRLPSENGGIQAAQRQKSRKPFYFRFFSFRPFLPRLPSENGGIQAAQRQKSRKPFYFRFFSFRPFLPRLPSENGGIQAAQRQKSRKPFYFRFFNSGHSFRVYLRKTGALKPRNAKNLLKPARPRGRPMVLPHPAKHHLARVAGMIDNIFYINTNTNLRFVRKLLSSHYSSRPSELSK